MSKEQVEIPHAGHMGEGINDLFDRIIKTLSESHGQHMPSEVVFRVRFTPEGTTESSSEVLYPMTCSDCGGEAGEHNEPGAVSRCNFCSSTLHYDK